MKKRMFVLLMIGATAIAQMVSDHTGTLYAQSSNSAIAYFNRGNDKFARKNYPGALEDFDAAIAFDPNFAAAYLNRGNAEFAQGNINAAIKDFDRAIEINPQLAEAYVMRSATRFFQSDFDVLLADSSK